MWHCSTGERGITRGGLGNSAETKHQGETIDQKLVIKAAFQRHGLHLSSSNISQHFYISPPPIHRPLFSLHFLPPLHRNIVTNRNELLVQFVSDLSITSDGFMAHYSSVPRGSRTPTITGDFIYGPQTTSMPQKINKPIKPTPKPRPGLQPKPTPKPAKKTLVKIPLKPPPRKPIVKPAVKPTPKPKPAKPTPKAPVKKPKPGFKPGAKPTPKPKIIKPTLKPSIKVKPTRKPALKTKPTIKPGVKPVKPTSKSRVKPTAKPKVKPKVTPKPRVSKTVTKKPVVSKKREWN